MLTGKLGDKVGRNGRGIGERFVEVADNTVEEVLDIWSHNEFCMLGVKRPGDRASVFELTVGAFLESDREGVHRLVGDLAHQPNDGA